MAEVMTDGRMSHYSELYQPCPVEEFLSKELGVWSYNVMLFAVANPALQVSSAACCCCCCCWLQRALHSASTVLAVVSS
jgi:hypothetical protein